MVRMPTMVASVVVVTALFTASVLAQTPPDTPDQAAKPEAAKPAERVVKPEDVEFPEFDDFPEADTDGESFDVAKALHGVVERMTEVTDDLGAERTGTAVQRKQDAVIDSLDQLIAQLEKDQNT